MKRIPLLKGGYTTVDDDVFEQVSGVNWGLSSHGYAVRYTSYYVDGQRKRRVVYLHRLLTGFKPGTVDHVNGDKLDNRLGNLRVCESWQNNLNKPSKNPTGLKGVYRRAAGTYYARITTKGKVLNLGSFSDAAQAARAYDSAAMEYFGEFARLNNV